jgi:hypothetical protein
MPRASNLFLHVQGLDTTTPARKRARTANGWPSYRRRDAATSVATVPHRGRKSAALTVYHRLRARLLTTQAARRSRLSVLWHRGRRSGPPLLAPSYAGGLFATSANPPWTQA